jgi:predicted Fe-S protein YdhL (DUF1289 family)
MTFPHQALWTKLTDAQRARVIAILVQILLRQLAKQQEVEQL